MQGVSSPSALLATFFNDRSEKLIIEGNSQACGELPKRGRVAVRFRASRSLNILIVDDNTLYREYLTGTVEILGHKTEVAEDGARAIEIHEAGNFDLILMDVRMPKVSGPDATKMIRRMKKDKAKIPIIALTADTNEEQMLGYFEAGMNDVVPKPVDRAVLTLAINKVMGEKIHDGAEINEAIISLAQSQSGHERKHDDENVRVALDDLLSQIDAITDGNDD